MLGRMEHVDLAALIAPRPLLVENGRDDLLFPLAAGRGVAGPAAPGLRPHRRRRPPGPRRLRRRAPVARALAYPFLDRWLAGGLSARLGPVPRPVPTRPGRRRRAARPSPGRGRRWRAAVRCRIEAGHAVLDGTLQGRPHRLGLAGLGHHGQDLPGPQQGRDGHGDGLVGHVGLGGEVALVDLLAPAGLVQRHHLHIERVVEVGDRRVVEGQVPVLADAQAAEVERKLAQQFGVASALRRRAGPARRGSGRPAGGRAPRSARGSSAGSRPDGRGRRRRTRPCGRRRCRPRARRRRTRGRRRRRVGSCRWRTWRGPRPWRPRRHAGARPPGGRRRRPWPPGWAGPPPRVGSWWHCR